MVMALQHTPSPISPANAGAQIQPERLGMMRLFSEQDASRAQRSIWVPAFAGKIGFEGSEGAHGQT